MTTFLMTYSYNSSESIRQNAFLHKQHIRFFMFSKYCLIRPVGIWTFENTFVQISENKFQLQAITNHALQTVIL